MTIGSVWTKPIIDILVEVPKEFDLSNYKTFVLSNGYICMTQNEDSISV